MPEPTRRPLALAVTAAALAAASVPAAVALVAHFALFFRRAAFPLDLEWMEGGMLLHAARLGAGHTIYVPPSLDFIPYLYTPLYPALLGLLSKLLPLGYLLGRLVSILAFAGALALIVWAAARQAPRSGSLPGAAALAAGLCGAGTVAAGFAFTGSFFDLVRSDSLLLLLEAGALALALSGGSRRAALAGLCIALAFFTKQTAAVLGIAIGLGLFAVSWRRAVCYGLCAAAALAAGLLLLQATSGGWFWRYVFELHQSHGFNARLAYLETPLRLLRHGAAGYLALAVATTGLALLRRLERADLIHGLVALAGFIAACVGFGTQWAFDNAFIPALYFPFFSATLLTARLAALLINSTTPLPLPVAACSLLACLGLGAQSLSGVVPDTNRFVPGARDRAAAARFLEQLRALQGPLFVPFHPWYPVLAGQPPHVHRMGVLDVAASFGRPAGLDQALADGRFAHVILDWKSQPWEWPTLDQRYHEVHQFTDGVDAVRSFSGAETSPRRLLARTTAPPPLPPGARLVSDFERGWQGFVPEGHAFGLDPAPAQAGLSGRGAADSRRYGPAALGSLRSPALTVDRRHLRFTLAGPADPALRVLLLDGPEAARVASPTGRTQVIEWDLGELQNRAVTLVVEDRSAAAGLAIDDVVVY